MPVQINLLCYSSFVYSSTTFWRMKYSSLGNSSIFPSYGILCEQSQLLLGLQLASLLLLFHTISIGLDRCFRSDIVHTLAFSCGRKFLRLEYYCDYCQNETRWLGPYCNLWWSWVCRGRNVVELRGAGHRGEGLSNALCQSCLTLSLIRSQGFLKLNVRAQGEVIKVLFCSFVCWDCRHILNCNFLLDTRVS